MSRTIMRNVRLPRRRFLALASASLGGALLSGCDRLSEAPDFQEFLASAEWLTYRVQRLLGGGHALAPGFGPPHLSPGFQGKCTNMAAGEDYPGLRGSDFAALPLRLRGPVAH